ncbi:unnamed protein product [Oppiella nova]|uniref:Uncharacterized protein n=1 Tax=Oppiella nova TaxID=334625 RepID=A0A7R9QDB2_9ACAR|nr:unnamed protein product [Oppiella nova]CAG2162742.1 unnamed protein product [Oppiella nova]
MAEKIICSAIIQMQDIDYITEHFQTALYFSCSALKDGLKLRLSMFIILYDSGQTVDLSHIERIEKPFRRSGFISSQSYDMFASDRSDDRIDGSPFHHMLYNNHKIEPYFDSTVLSTNVTISEGSAATYLPCRVHQLGDRTRI